MWKIFSRQNQAANVTPEQPPLETKTMTVDNTPQLIAETYSLLRTSAGSLYAIPILPQQAMQHFNTIAPVDIAANRVSKGVASLPYELVDATTGIEAIEPAISDLFRFPNATTHRILADFMDDLTLSLLLYGFAAIQTTGVTRPQELFLLNPRDLTLEHRQISAPPKRIHNTATPSTPYTLDERDGFYYSDNRAQQVHLITQNSFFTNQPSGNVGRSTLASLNVEVSHYLAATAHNLSLLKNGCRPPGALVLEGQNGAPVVLSDEAFGRLRTQFNESYATPENAGKPLILEGGMKWVEMSLRPKDLDFAQLKTEAEEKIYQTFGVPIQLIMDAKTTANNLQSFRLEFYENRVLPIGDKICEHLNMFILPRFKKTNLQFRVNRDNIDVLLSKRIEKQRALEQSTVFTINEKRAKLKLEPIKDGNKIVDPNGRPIAGEDAPVDTQISPVPATPIAGATQPA